jgi:hypothetical protein
LPNRLTIRAVFTMRFPRFFSFIAASVIGRVGHWLSL